MGKRNYLKWGDYNYICQRCGQMYKFSEIKKEWTHLRVCPSCWEPRHPQDYVRGLSDDQNVPTASPRGELEFVD